MSVSSTLIARYFRSIKCMLIFLSLAATFIPSVKLSSCLFANVINNSVIAFSFIYIYIYSLALHIFTCIRCNAFSTVYSAYILIDYNLLLSIYFSDTVYERVNWSIWSRMQCTLNYVEYLVNAHRKFIHL